ncbi:MAG: 4-diphosphocytidyl-2-C-methyl-D-erythritol kinase [Lentimonas sp.]|jgi:4-diphosphocytidyl-2-C-methyl-D-erythritol kinase
MNRKSFAKINLYLELIGKNSNNYHLLDSLMTQINIFDEISICESKNLELEIKGKNCDSLQKNSQSNIIIKAVNLLAEMFHFKPNIKITLNKQIPIAAGLGGGSSNAATILLMLNDFYNLNLSQKQLLNLGLKLGADVPFFINEKPALVSGIGEIIEPANFDFSNLFLLIVNPNKNLSTQSVFQSLNLKNTQSKPSTKNDDLISSIKNRRNDLENPAIKFVPEIKLILDQLEKQKGCLISRMSGSGASCFGIFNSQTDLDNVNLNFPNFYIKRTTFH